MDEQVGNTRIGRNQFTTIGKKVSLPQSYGSQNVLNVVINDTSPPSTAIYTLNPFYNFQALNSCTLKKVYLSLSARTLAGINIPIPLIRLGMGGAFGLQNSFIEIAKAAEADKAQFLNFTSSQQFIDVNFKSGLLLSANTSIPCTLTAQFPGALAVDDIIYGVFTLVFEE